VTTGLRGTVGITGANGYLGSLFRTRLREDGWDTVDLVRSRPSGGKEWRPYSLVDQPDAHLLDGLTVLVHCAYDMRQTRWPDIYRTNVAGTARLLQASRDKVKHVVVVSSMSAYDGTHQLYGRAKLLIEKDALAAGAVVVRPGLVYGPNPGGMVGSLTKLARLPLLPVPARRSHQFTIHEDDLAASLSRIVESAELGGQIFGLAHHEPVRFEKIITQLARRDGTSVRVLPLPWQALYGAMRAAELLPVSLPVRADSLLGLARPAPSVPNVAELAKLGVQIRPFDDGSPTA
jgi:nucleoside-diphosphate-sugar epimerase